MSELEKPQNLGCYLNMEDLRHMSLLQKATGFDRSGVARCLLAIGASLIARATVEEFETSKQAQS